MKPMLDLLDSQEIVCHGDVEWRETSWLGWAHGAGSFPCNPRLRERSKFWCFQNTLDCETVALGGSLPRPKMCLWLWRRNEVTRHIMWMRMPTTKIENTGELYFRSLGDIADMLVGTTRFIDYNRDLERRIKDLQDLCCCLIVKEQGSPQPKSIYLRWCRVGWAFIDDIKPVSSIRSSAQFGLFTLSFQLWNPQP